MGLIQSYCGIEKLIDPSYSTIDLRYHTKSVNLGNQLICNVYIGTHNINSQNVRFLYTVHMDIVYCLGEIQDSHFLENNHNHSVITVENGRKYIVHTYIDEFKISPNIKICYLNHYLNRNYN